MQFEMHSTQRQVDKRIPIAIWEEALMKRYLASFSYKVFPLRFTAVSLSNFYKED